MLSVLAIIEFNHHLIGAKDGEQWLAGVLQASGTRGLVSYPSVHVKFLSEI